MDKIQSKCESKNVGKSLVIKKICKKYLKIINELMGPSNVEESLVALEMVKFLQLDIYEGKSYELYPIKIGGHLLFVRGLELKMEREKEEKGREEIKKRKRVYVERLKIFVEEVESSFFWELLAKDYYSNLELVLFLVVRHQMESILDLQKTRSLSTEALLIELVLVKNYIAKIFELLKAHIVELNEMLFYLENKVYELLTAKVKLLIQLFNLEAQTLFLQHVAEKFSDRQWALYKLFLQDQTQQPPSSALNMTRKTMQESKNSKTKSNNNPVSHKTIGFQL